MVIFLVPREFIEFIYTQHLSGKLSSIVGATTPYGGFSRILIMLEKLEDTLFSDLGTYFG